MLGRRSAFSDTPPVVKNLIIINILIYFAMRILPLETSNFIIEKFGLFFWESPFFSPHQVVTSIFLHGGLFHLFFNMFSLWMFGQVIEYDLGSKRFLTYYMITGIGASLIHLLAVRYDISSPSLSQTAIMQIANTPAIGASGACFGILLAYGMFHPNNVLMLLFPPIPIKAKYFVMMYGAIELFSGISGFDTGVAHFAHLGGLLWGYILLRWWKSRGTIYY